MRRRKICINASEWSSIEFNYFLIELLSETQLWNINFLINQLLFSSTQNREASVQWNSLMSCKTGLVREDNVQDLFHQINLKPTKEQSRLQRDIS